MEKLIHTFRSLVCALILLVPVSGLLAQDPNFSQFYNNPVYYNPGMTAISNGLTLRMNVRSLWTPIPGKFNTASAGFEAEAINKVGFGMLAFTDVAGEGLLRTTGGNLYYSYRAIDTRNFILQAGISTGLVNKTVDWSKFTFSDQLDEVFGNINGSSFVRPSFNSVVYADFGTGFAMRFNSRSKRAGTAYKRITATLGGAAHHLTQPKDAFLGDKERLPMKFTGHFNANILINKLIYSPAMIYERQNEFQTFTVGVSVVNKPFTAGFWFRNRTIAMSPQRYDSFIITVGANLPVNRATTLRIMYGFDMTISRLKTSSIGSHEVSLILDFDDVVLFGNLQKRNSNKRKYRCPTDFRGYD